MEEEALKFARQAHADQKRKYSEELYITHPIRVAELVRSVPHDSEMISAAYLHDVVEDTSVDLPEIRNRFGSRVAELVNDLTDAFTKENYPNLNRKTRKEKEVLRQANISPDAQTIKLADVIDNTLDIVRNDPNFARRYVPEMKSLVKVLHKGDPELLKMAREEVKKGEEILKGRFRKRSKNPKADGFSGN